MMKRLYPELMARDYSTLPAKATKCQNVGLIEGADADIG
jgi:hypothetical protein